MLKKEVAVQLMKHLVDHDWHGYSQGARWGDGEGTCDINIGGKVYRLEQGDRDCSSAIISAYQAAGISCGGATYTGNMRACMTRTGNFVWKPMSSGYIAQAGDVYLNEVNHTAMCLSASPDLLMEFSISETGGVYGHAGDQTGQESHTRAYYNYPWDGILQCVNKESAEVVAQKPINNSKSKGEAVMYCTYKITDLNKDKVYFFNGEKSFPLEHPDELKILRQIYKDNNGHDLPHYNWTSKAPWFARLKGAVTGEAPNFFIKK